MSKYKFHEMNEKVIIKTSGNDLVKLFRTIEIKSNQDKESWVYKHELRRVINEFFRGKKVSI